MNWSSGLRTGLKRMDPLAMLFVRFSAMKRWLLTMTLILSTRGLTTENSKDIHFFFTYMVEKTLLFTQNKLFIIKEKL